MIYDTWLKLGEWLHMLKPGDTVKLKNEAESEEFDEQEVVFDCFRYYLEATSTVFNAKPDRIIDDLKLDWNVSSWEGLHFDDDLYIHEGDIDDWQIMFTECRSAP